MKSVVASCGAVLVFAAPGLVLGDDNGRYRVEAELEYVRADTDTGRSSSTGLTGTYYFHALPVLPKDYPLGLGPFVERSASVEVTYSWLSFGDSDDSVALDDGSSYSGRMVLRRPDTPLYAEASYRYADFGKARLRSSSIEYYADTESYGLAAGAYVARTSLLVLDWARSVSRTSNLLSSGTVVFKNIFVDIGLGGQHLAQLPNGDHVAVSARVGKRTYKLELEGRPTEKNDSVSLAATYYPTRMLGLNAGLTRERGDILFLEGDTWKAGARLFVTPAASLLLEFSRFQAKAPDFDYDLITLAGSMRF